MQNKTIFFLLFAFHLVSKSYGQIIVPSQRELSYIINIAYKGGSQTGFFYGTNDGKNLLVTAKHLFNQKIKREEIVKGKKVIKIFDSLMTKNGDTISFSINQSNGWTKYSGKVYFNSNPKVDIAVIKHTIKLDSGAYIFDHNNAVFGQDCFFPGFPLGFTMDKRISWHGMIMPIIKKGVISAMGITLDKVTYFLIDGNNTYGLSGSPVLFYDYKLKVFKVLGVISGYMPQINIKYDSKGNKTEQEENSGIFIAHAIEHLNEIIHNIK